MSESEWPPEPQWGNRPMRRGKRFWYMDYDGERVEVWHNNDGDLWIDKHGEGPVFIRKEHIAMIVDAMKGDQ